MSSGNEGRFSIPGPKPTDEDLDTLVRLGYNIVVDTRFYLALISAMEVLVVSILLDYPLTIAPLIFALLTFSVYLNDQIIDVEDLDIESERAREFVEENKEELYIFGAVSYGMALSLSAVGGPLAFAVTLVPGVAWILYASNAMGAVTAKIGTGFTVVQDLFLVNTTLVALAWTGTLMMLPLAFVNETVTTRHLLVSVYFFVRVWVNTETSNIPDVASDREAGISTLPTEIGVDRTRHVLYALNFGTICLLGVAVLTGFLSEVVGLGLAAGAVYSLAVVGVSGRYRDASLTRIAEYEFAIVFLILAGVTLIRGWSPDFFTGDIVPATAAIVLLLAIGIGASAALIAWQERPEPGALPLVAMLAGQVWWAVTLFLEFKVDDVATMVFFSNLGWVGVVVIPVGWVAFALEYTGRSRWIQPKYLLVLGVVPALTVFLAFTTPYNTLLYRDLSVASIQGVEYLVRSPGPWFWVITAYTYLAGAVGVVLLLGETWADSLRSRRQGVALILGAIAPWVTNMLFVSGALPFEGVDPTPLAFAVTGVAYLSAMTRFQLLGASPTPSRSAPAVAFKRMDLAAIVVDRNGFVVQANDAADDLFEADSNDLLGRTVDELIPESERLLDEGQSTVEVDGRTFETVLTPVTDPYGRTVSRIITLSDISSYIRQQQRLEVINRLFRHNVNTKLHVLGAFEGIGGGRVESSLDITPTEVIQELERLSERVRDVIEVFELERESERVPLSRVVDGSITEVEREYPGAVVVRDIDDEADHVRVDEVAKYVVGNVLENAVEHNDDPTPEVSVEVTVGDGRATVTVADDGPGIDDDQLAVIRERRETDLHHLDGLGLWIAVWGTEILGGELTFEENTPTGTVVTVRFPVER